MPRPVPECTAGQKHAQATLQVLSKPGAYRLFVTRRGSQGGASKGNIRARSSVAWEPTIDGWRLAADG